MTNIKTFCKIGIKSQTSSGRNCEDRKPWNCVGKWNTTHHKPFTLPPTERPIVENFPDSHILGIKSKDYDISQQWNSHIIRFSPVFRQPTPPLQQYFHAVTLPPYVLTSMHINSKIIHSSFMEPYFTATVNSQ